MTSVAVVGAGVSGLACAWRLLKAGADVRVFERSAVVGGPMQSFERDRFAFERGPNNIQSSSANTMALIRELSLEGQLITSRPEAKKRLIWRHGKLHVLPENPRALLRSELLTMRGKLRALAEPLVRPPRHASDETLAEFFGRRLGPEVVRAFIDPFVAGVFTGLPEQLGVDAFPSMMDVEQHYGGLMRAMRAKRKAGGTRPGGANLVAFKDGMQALPAAVATELGQRLHRSTAVERLEFDGDGAQGVTLTVRAGHSTQSLSFDHVVFATPAHITGDLLKPHQARITHHLDAPRLETAQLDAVALGYRRQDVAHPMDAFGALFASDSPLASSGPILGVLFPSSIFEGRAPDGHVSMRVMIGGARDPGAAELSTEGLILRAKAAMREVLGASGEPVLAEATRWPKSVPQYGPGHLSRMTEVLDLVAELGPVTLAGNYLAGVGVDASIGSGFDAAASVLRQVR